MNQHRVVLAYTLFAIVLLLSRLVVTDSHFLILSGVFVVALIVQMRVVRWLRTRWEERAGRILDRILEPENIQVVLRFTRTQGTEFRSTLAPSGEQTIWLSDGAYSLADDEDALAFVLAHEVGHFVLGHLQWLRERFPTPTRDLSMTSTEQATLREMEFEADRWATEYLTRQGIDPRAMARSFDLLQHRRDRLTTLRPVSDSHHPTAAERLEAAGL